MGAGITRCGGAVTILEVTPNWIFGYYETNERGPIPARWSRSGHYGLSEESDAIPRQTALDLVQYNGIHLATFTG